MSTLEEVDRAKWAASGHPCTLDVYLAIVAAERAEVAEMVAKFDGCVWRGFARRDLDKLKLRLGMPIEQSCQS